MNFAFIGPEEFRTLLLDFALAIVIVDIFITSLFERLGAKNLHLISIPTCALLVVTFLGHYYLMGSQDLMASTIHAIPLVAAAHVAILVIWGKICLKRKSDE